jgi:hypothetical protein
MASVEFQLFSILITPVGASDEKPTHPNRQSRYEAGAFLFLAFFANCGMIRMRKESGCLFLMFSHANVIVDL